MSHTELALFLAHSLALESEARERYLELSESLAAHHNGDAAAFFQRMAREAEQHLQEVAELAADQALPQLHPWEYAWPGPEAPESASYEALHYRMSLSEAMHLALGKERDAAAYYRHVASESPDTETRRVAAGFAAEEERHAAALEAMIAELDAPREYHRLDEDDPHLPA
ncbi:MAG: rubrerythrin [Haliea sp.]|nr:ferritin family protein [Haliea sp.]HAN67881.1 rubrerythrin [Halieaceae bacterium]MAD63862.1 rubrerythrin [Haliea sp.]MAY92223.1 rubrerythrin [Haliea sp.]MBK42147.1 rubrerythrin [Haliea sp.]MBP69793.1 rubrerythrin [Haliea sp.]